jgi:SAM-dependent methyltransferase
VSAFFGELYLRTTRPFLDAKVTQLEVDYLATQLKGVGVSGPLLDFGCGHGRHFEVASRLARPLIGLDRDPLSLSEARHAATVVRADFFAPPFRPGAFAAGWAWYNSIFTFPDAQIQALIGVLARLIRPGGLLILHTLPRERIASQPQWLYDDRLPDGSHLIERVRFNPENGRDEGRRILTLTDGRVMAADYFIRYYFLDELEAMLELVGFRVVFVHGGLDARPVSGDSADLIVGAQRG